jgi:hypothetical protein
VDNSITIRQEQPDLNWHSTEVREALSASSRAPRAQFPARAGRYFGLGRPSVQALQRAAHTRIALPMATRDRTYEARAKKAQRARGHEDGRARGSNSTKTSESPCTMRVCGLCSFFSLEARILASRFDSSHLAAVQDVRKDRLDLQSVCSSLLQTFCRAGGLLKHSAHWPVP